MAHENWQLELKVDTVMGTLHRVWRKAGLDITISRQDAVNWHQFFSNMPNQWEGESIQMYDDEGRLMALETLREMFTAKGESIYGDATVIRIIYWLYPMQLSDSDKIVAAFNHNQYQIQIWNHQTDSWGLRQQT